MDLIQRLETEEIARLGKSVPDFKPGDTVVVNVKIVELGEGVERTFQTHSPLIASIEVKRRGDVSRAKLYYLRQLSGKAARIKERLALSADDVLPPVENEQQADAK